MKINKQSPPDNVKAQLLNTLQTEKNERYAKRILSNHGEYRRVILKGVLSAAAVFVVAVAIAVFALIGREIWHSGKITPATAPDYPNYIFIEGKFAGMAKDGEFNELLLSEHTFTYSELLGNKCFYDMGGNEINEIYINVSELTGLTRDETVSAAERLKKYSSGEYRNYYKFTLPVTFSDEDLELSMTTANVNYMFTEHEIDNGALEDGHTYVSTYKLNIKPLESFKTTLTEKEMVTLANLTEQTVYEFTPVYSADIDGDGKKEKIADITSDVTYSGNAYNYIAVIDDEDVWFVYSYYQAMQGESPQIRTLTDLVDFDLDGKYEIVLNQFNALNKKVYIYSGATEVMSVYTMYEQTGITIREFAARVANMALGTPYDPEYPSDEVCEWYMRAYQTENINLDNAMSYNQIYFGVEMFANMYHFDLKGWDKEAIWEPIANLYDPTTTAPRAYAESMLLKAKTAFENADVKIDIDIEKVKSIEVYNSRAFKQFTITDEGWIKQLVEFLNKTPIENAKSIPGLPAADINTIAVKDTDGNSLFSCMYEADKFYIRGCEYTLKDNYFESILDLQ